MLSLSPHDYYYDCFAFASLLFCFSLVLLRFGDLIEAGMQSCFTLLQQNKLVRLRTYICTRENRRKTEEKRCFVVLIALSLSFSFFLSVILFLSCSNANQIRDALISLILSGCCHHKVNEKIVSLGEEEEKKLKTTTNDTRISFIDFCLAFVLFCFVLFSFS